MRTETELVLSLLFLIMWWSTIALFFSSPTPPTLSTQNTRFFTTHILARTHTHFFAKNTLRNSFDFRHSRRHGHERLCRFEPARTRFYRLQRKQITTCIELRIGKKIFVWKSADYHNRKIAAVHSWITAHMKKNAGTDSSKRNYKILRNFSCAEFFRRYPRNASKFR